MRRLAIFLLFVVFVASRAVAASYACPLVPRLFAAPLSFIASPVVANVAFAEDSLYTDGMGSVGALVPENGTAANAGHFRYDAYGNFRTEAHPGDCSADPSGLTCNAPLTYTGHLYDQESGLFYFGARYYDPETGRFLTNDPVAGDALNPPSLHKYLYAYDSPMVYTDPWGETSWDEGTQDYASNQFGQEHWWQNLGGKALAIGAITVHAAFEVASVGAVSKIDRAQEQLDRGQIDQNEYWEKVGYAGATTAGVMATGGGGGALAARGAAALGLGADATAVVAGVGGGLAGQAGSDVVGNVTGEQKGLSSWQTYVGAGVMGGTFGYLGAKYQAETSAPAASEPVMQTERGIKPVEEAPQATNREYISDEVTTQAREARNAPNAAKVSTDVPADNYNHGPFIVSSESAARSSYRPGEVKPDGQIAGDGPGAALSSGATRPGAPSGGTTGERFYRYVGEAEAAVIRRTGTIPNVNAAGEPKEVYFSDRFYQTAGRAKTHLQLPKKPSYRVEIDPANVPHRTLFNKVAPDANPDWGIGGGTEASTSDSIPVDPSKMVPLKGRLK